MAPPKTLAIGQHQQQQQFSTTNVQQQTSPAKNNQVSAKARNRKAKQQQQSSPPDKLTQQRDTTQHGAPIIAPSSNQHSADQSKQTNAHDNGVNHEHPQQQVELLNDDTNLIKIATNSHSTTTNNSAKIGSPINTTKTNNINTPAPSERITVKQRKEVQASIMDSPTKQQQVLNNEKNVTQRNTAQINDTNDIATNLAQTQQKHQTTTTQPSLTSQKQQSKTAAEVKALATNHINHVDDNNSNQLIVSKHQSLMSTDETDDIDAGIELDGSSNSGSSVKDGSEDQMKSNSVSPVMPAQSAPVVQPSPTTRITTSESNAKISLIGNEDSLRSIVKKPRSQKLVATQEPVGAQSIVVESLPSDILVSSASSELISVATASTTTPPTRTTSSSTPLSSVCDAGAPVAAISVSKTNKDNQQTLKKKTMTREELAKERQVIEEDEQLLQEKLESKQRKVSGGSLSSLLAGSSPNVDVVSATEHENHGRLVNGTSDSKNKKNLGQQQTNSNGDLTTTTSSSTPTNPLKNDKSSSARLKRQFSTTTGNASGNNNEINGAGLKSLCKNCGQHVYQMERMLAEKSLYHKQCFRCHQCKIQLRIDNYASHAGQVYCKSHHKQIFQPKVKLNDEGDCDNVAKSTTKLVDEYLLQRGRLSELTFSFLNSSTEGSRQRQMIICENEPVELSKDVVRSDTKIDDGINNIKLNLNNIMQKFENGGASNDSDSQPSSGSPIIIEKPRFNIKQKLAAFENNQVMPQDDSSDGEQQQKENNVVKTEKPVVGKLGNVANFLNKFNSQDDNNSNEHRTPARTVRRSESLMGRLKKYESRIAGEKVDDDSLSSSSADEQDNGDNCSDKKIKRKSSSSRNNNMATNNVRTAPSPKKIDIIQYERSIDPSSGVSSLVKKQQDRVDSVPKLSSIDLSGLKNRWENGDIKNVSHDRDDADDNNELNNNNQCHLGNGDDKTTCINSPMVAEKKEELHLIRQQLAQRKAGKTGSVKNIYENALREAEEQQKNQLALSRRDSSDLSALNGLSTSEIQQQLLNQKQQNNNHVKNNHVLTTTTTTRLTNTPMFVGNNNNNDSTSNNNNNITKDHFQLNLSRKANKLKEKFELGLINNSHDDSDMSDSNDSPALSKLEQIRQEKMEDLSVFTDGEIKAREARSMFQQIDRRLSSSGQTPTTPGAQPKNFTHNSRSTAPVRT